MKTITLQAVNEQFDEVFKADKHKPWAEQEDNPTDGNCLLAQDGKVEVIRHDLDK